MLVHINQGFVVGDELNTQLGPRLHLNEPVLKQAFGWIGFSVQ